MSIAALMARIALGVSDALGVGYHPGRLRWRSSPVLDSGGSVAVAGTAVEIACRVQVDASTEAMRREEGYRELDMRLLVLADGLSRPLDTDAMVLVDSGPHVGSWRPLTVLRDPAGVYFEARGRRL